METSENRVSKITIFVAILALAPLTAARGGGDGVIDVNPFSLDFGTLVVGQTANQIVTVGNAGIGPLTVFSPSVEGPDAASFSVAASDCPGVPLQPAATCSIEVSFTPFAPAVETADLRIDSSLGVDSRIAAVAFPLPCPFHQAGAKIGRDIV